VSFLWGNTAQQPQEEKKFANISNDQINSNQQAIPVKYLAGRAYLGGDYITPAYNPRAEPIQTQTGKSESSTTGFKYFADFALVFCMGGRHPVDAIHKVIVDSDIRWRGNVTRRSSDREVIQVPNLGTLCIYWGSDTQAVDNVLLAARGTVTGGINPQDSRTWPANAPLTPQTPVHDSRAAGDANPFSGHYDRHPAYRGQCYGVFKNWKLGRDRTSVPNIQLELKRGCPWLGGAHVSADNLGVNPIAVLYDWLTDTRFGMALPESFLSANSFAQAYNELEALGARISPMISSQQDFRQAIAELMEYFDGWIRRAGRVLEVGIWKHGDVAPGPTLTDDDLLGEPELEPQGWGPTFNEITVVYKDRQHHFNDYTQVYRDPNNFRITGGPRPETLSRPWITDAQLAKQYAREFGAVMALPFTRGDLRVKREWLTKHNMQPGEVFTYNSGFYGLSFLLRLLELEHAADSAADATITVEWERSKWPSLYIPPPFQGPGGFETGPRAIWKSKVTEVPYVMEDQRFDTQVVTLAVRGNVEVQGYRTWLSVDGGATYQIIPNDASTNAFAIYGRTYGGIGDKDGGVGFNLYGIGLDEIVSQTPAQWNDDNLLLFIDSEVISIGKIITYPNAFYTAYIKRGRYGTAAASHGANSECFFIYRNNLRLLDNAGFIPGSQIKLKLQPFTADTDYDVTTITAPPGLLTYTIVGFPDIAPPVLSPAPGVFSSQVIVSARTAQTGEYKIRYTSDGTAVSGSAREWPRNPLNTGPYTTITLSASTTLRARVYIESGRASGEITATYTKVAATATVALAQQCGVPNWSFSGVLKHSSGNLTLSVTTIGSTIRFRKNAGPTQTYSSPIALGCTATGDTCEFWASKAGMDDSGHSFLSNAIETTWGGGGHQPARAPISQ
jgi:hypothetical protein